MNKQHMYKFDSEFLIIKTDSYHDIWSQFEEVFALLAVLLWLYQISLLLRAR